MELLIIGFLAAFGSLGYAFYLRICYIKHEAVCAEYLYTGKSFVAHLIYEYELIEGDKKVTYKNKGTSFFYPKKGKRYKVLINKKDHSKIVGYAEFVVNLFLGSLFLVASIWCLIDLLM